MSTATFSKAESEAVSKRSVASQETSVWDGMISLPESANTPSQDDSNSDQPEEEEEDDDIALAVGRGREAAKRDEETPLKVPAKLSERAPVIAHDEISTVASEEHYLPRYTCM